MTTRRAFIQAGTAFATCFAVGAGRSRAADAPGVTASEIKFGQTMPYSGPLSVLGVIGRAEAAYFQMINDMGGVNGRKLEFVSLDDAYSPPKTVEQTRRLIEAEQVAFIFGSFGGATTLATRQYLNDNKIPQIFVSSAADLVSDPAHFPWTLGLNPAISTEARVYAKHLLANRPDAKLGVLYQNDTLGRGFVTGIRDGLGASRASMIVKEVSYEVSDPSVDSQVATLQAAGADALIIAATSRAGAQAIRKAADLGWTPDRYLFSGASSIVGTLKPAGLAKSTGVISATYAKDPSDPRWAEDPGYKAWADFVAKRMTAKEFGDNAAVYGFNAAAVMVQVLKQCGDDLSRENILRQALNLRGFTPPMGLPGSAIETAPDNYLPIQQLQLAKFGGESIEGAADVFAVSQCDVPPHLGRTGGDTRGIAEAVRAEQGLGLGRGGVQNLAGQRGGGDMRQVARTAHERIVQFRGEGHDPAADGLPKFLDLLERGPVGFARGGDHADGILE